MEPSGLAARAQLHILVRVAVILQVDVRDAAGAVRAVIGIHGVVDVYVLVAHVTHGIVILEAAAAQVAPLGAAVGGTYLYLVVFVPDAHVPATALVALDGNRVGAVLADVDGRVIGAIADVAVVADLDEVALCDPLAALLALRKVLGINCAVLAVIRALVAYGVALAHDLAAVLAYALVVVDALDQVDVSATYAARYHVIEHVSVCKALAHEVVVVAVIGVPLYVDGIGLILVLIDVGVIGVCDAARVLECVRVRLVSAHGSDLSTRPPPRAGLQAFACVTEDTLHRASERLRLRLALHSFYTSDSLQLNLFANSQVYGRSTSELASAAGRYGVRGRD